MALIEGFGDEVILTLVVFVILTVLLLAWLSTGVRDRPLISVIVVDSQNFQRILQRISNLTFRPIQITRLGGGTNESAPARQESVENIDSTDATDTAQQSIEDEPPESSSNVSTDAQDSSENINSSNEGSPVDGTSSVTETTPEISSETTVKADTDAKSEEPAISTNNEEVSTAVVTTVETTNEDQPENEGEGDLRIRLKYLDDRQRFVRANADETVGDFKRKHFARELAENLMVRFIHNGQELRQDGNTLQAYNVSDNSVIHCLFSSRPAQETPQRQSTLIPEDWDAGYLMFPLFGLILGITWYFRIVYRTYFNAMSTFSLIGITFLFFIAFLASIRSHDEDEILD